MLVVLPDLPRLRASALRGCLVRSPKQTNKQTNKQTVLKKTFEGECFLRGLQQGIYLRQVKKSQASRIEAVCSVSVRGKVLLFFLLDFENAFFTF
jgi:hypothetical protein